LDGGLASFKFDEKPHTDASGRGERVLAQTHGLASLANAGAECGSVEHLGFYHENFPIGKYRLDARFEPLKFTGREN
jgi:hypothetical protein